MKHIVALYFNISGIDKRFKAVKKKTGINALNYDLLRYKNLGPWFQNTFMWLFLLEDPYLVDRIAKLTKENPRYSTHMALFMPLFHSGPDSTIKLLKAMDEACLKATGHLFPDQLLDTAIPPGGGPIYDLLNAIAEENKIVPYKLIDPWVLSLGLQFSKVRKDINDLRTITKRDIRFLAEFVCRIAEDEVLTEKIIHYLKNEDLFAILLIAITPDEPVRYLEYDTFMVNKGLQQVSDTIAMYEEKPAILDSVYAK